MRKKKYKDDKFLPKQKRLLRWSIFFAVLFVGFFIALVFIVLFINPDFKPKDILPLLFPFAISGALSYLLYAKINHNQNKANVGGKFKPDEEQPKEAVRRG